MLLGLRLEQWDNLKSKLFLFLQHFRICLFKKNTLNIYVGDSNEFNRLAQCELKALPERAFPLRLMLLYRLGVCSIWLLAATRSTAH